MTLIATMTCGTPPMTFRDFYQSYYYEAGPSWLHWQGGRAETQETVIIRVTDAVADYTEYRLAWGEQCGVRR